MAYRYALIYSKQWLTLPTLLLPHPRPHCLMLRLLLRSYPSPHCLTPRLLLCPHLCPHGLTLPLSDFFPTTTFPEKIESSLENNFSAKMTSILQEFVFNICTRRAEESGINLSGTLKMKPESTSLKVLAIIKSFGAGRTKWWHFCFSSLNCTFCPLLPTTSRRGSSAEAREIKFFKESCGYKD